MTASVVSGVPYRVLEIDGRAATGLEELSGAAMIVVDGRTGRHHLTGHAAVREGTARFYEKTSPTGKDVRVWRIALEPEAGLVAVALSAPVGER